jgi:D-beta-D-heptose 7-phosphate kinase/D-beta-D-heptose 1-phosphate adenosyltransferase
MNLNVQDILSNIARFDRCRIAVIGDLMLDEYLWGHIERISPEAPVPILNVVRREWTLGGAGNVVENLRSLGVQVAAFGVVGNDETGEKVRALLSAHGADVRGVILDPYRKSTRKARLMSLEHGQQVFRLDEESTQPACGEMEDRFISMIRAVAGDVQAILCSDYMKGVLTERVLGVAFGAARERGIPCIVAPKDSNAQKYCGASILMPNSRELMQLVGAGVDGDGWLNDSARRLIERLNLEALLVTRGSEGMSLFENVEGGLRRVDIPTTARSVYDVTGAGDTAIATFAAALASGSDRESAAHLANLAAGIKVGKRGTACVSSKELIEGIGEEDVRRQELRSEGCSNSVQSVIEIATQPAGVP